MRFPGHAFLAFLLLGQAAPAAFHVMQIQEVIAGVNGDMTAQAIQLRLRSGGQNQVQGSKIWASDATGANRVLLLDITSLVNNGTAGATVLLSTSKFNSLMVAGGATTYAPNFTLASAIPASYLAAGRITFEDNAGNASTSGTIYWSFAWGGANYTGSNTGDSINTTAAANGNFGSAFGSPLPTASRQGVIFTGSFSAASSSNSTDYAFSANPATVTRNDGVAFSVVPEPGTSLLLLLGGLVGGGLVFSRRQRA